MVGEEQAPKEPYAAGPSVKYLQIGCPRKERTGVPFLRA
jgi:hypothetical protein